MEKLIENEMDKLTEDERIVLDVLDRLSDEETYFVGGLLRDMLLNRYTHDVDVVYVGTIERLKACLEGLEYVESQFMTLKVNAGHYHVDIACSRKETYDTFARGLPTTDYAGIKRDIWRRDFTINTGYMRLCPETIETVTQYLFFVNGHHKHFDKEQDLHAVYRINADETDTFDFDITEDKGVTLKDGKVLFDKEVDDLTLAQLKKKLPIAYCHPCFYHDLLNRVIRQLRPNSFWEDPTRLFRAMRYCVKLHATLEKETENCFNEAIKDNVIERLSQQRIQQEILKAFEAENWLIHIKYLYDVGLLVGAECEYFNHLEEWWVNGDRFLESLKLSIMMRHGQNFMERKSLSQLDLLELFETLIGRLSQLKTLPLFLRLISVYGESVDFFENVNHDLNKAIKDYKCLLVYFKDLFSQHQDEDTMGLIEKYAEKIYQMLEDKEESALYGVIISLSFYESGQVIRFIELLSLMSHEWRDYSSVISGDDLIAVGVEKGPEIGKLKAQIMRQELVCRVTGQSLTKEGVLEKVRHSVNG